MTDGFCDMTQGECKINIVKKQSRLWLNVK